MFRVDPTAAGYSGSLLVAFQPDADNRRQIVWLSSRPDSPFDPGTTLIRGVVTRAGPNASAAGIEIAAVPRRGDGGAPQDDDPTFTGNTDERGCFAVAVYLEPPDDGDLDATVETALTLNRGGARTASSSCTSTTGASTSSPSPSTSTVPTSRRSRTGPDRERDPLGPHPSHRPHAAIAAAANEPNRPTHRRGGNRCLSTWRPVSTSRRSSAGPSPSRGWLPARPRSWCDRARPEPTPPGHQLQRVPALLRRHLQRCGLPAVLGQDVLRQRGPPRLHRPDQRCQRRGGERRPGRLHADGHGRRNRVPPGAGPHRPRHDEGRRGRPGRLPAAGLVLGQGGPERPLRRPGS